MDLNEILEQPEGFCPPSVTITVDKVFAYKHGESDQGEYSFQDIKAMGGGTIKLKNLLREFPESRVGQTVTIKANQSKNHGLTGLKVVHEAYQGKTYDKLIVTPSAKWEWGSANGNGAQPIAAAKPTQDIATIRSDSQVSETVYQDHILSCTELANVVVAQLEITDPAAIQACFATICIDTKNRNLLLPKPKTLPLVSGQESGPEHESNPFDDDNGEPIPF
jgi:hypothetical protein